MGLKPKIHIDKMLKPFSIKNDKEWFLPKSHGKSFARLGVPKHWWAKYMMEIPHTLVFGLIMFSMVCKNNQICPILQSCYEYRYQSDQKYWSWDNSEKGSLSTKVALMTCFLASRDHEEFVVKGYIDTVFINSPCDFWFKLRVLCNTQYGGTVS
jgi:hypothetical protein